MSAAHPLAFGVVDAHHHFWDLERNPLPWLTEEPRIPGRHGDYGPICRTFMPDHYRREAGAIPISHTVYVETEWDPADPVGESRWIAGLAATDGWPSAAVVGAWLDRDDIADVLAAHAAYPIVRGVRNKPAQAQSPHAPPPGPRGSMSEDRWRRGYALLERFGFSFDLQVAHWHLGEAAALARDFPGTLLILDHTGLPADRSPAGLGFWRRSMERLAGEPNVRCKLSGLGQPDLTWSPETHRDVIRDTIAIFGVDRCMFGSNFPVERLYVGLEAVFDGFAAMVADRDPADLRKLFRDNALAAYRIETEECRGVTA